jgi:soluble lytic murein transglycosylase
MLLRSVSMIALAALLGWSAPGAAQTAAQGALLERALDAAAAGDWLEAEHTARRTGSKVAADLVTWVRLKDGAGHWDEYQRFLELHPGWPARAAIARAAERRMPSGQDPAAVIAFFADAPPQTATGALRRSDALAAAGRQAEAEAEAVRAWESFSMTGLERTAVLARWKAVLAGHHQARLDMLLWRGLAAEAEAMLPLVDADHAALARARIAVRRDEAGLQTLIARVPPKLADDPGLAFERYLYRIDKRRWQEAEDYLREKSTSAEALGQPDHWMKRRANLARQALEDGQVQEAYAIAANNFGSAGPDYADAEWVAGFIALTRLDDPERAVGHFERFRAAVATPISLGRAGYWLGRAYAAAGAPEEARAAYAFGALQQTSFYGQLAAAAIGLPPDPTLTGAEAVPDWKREPFMRTDLVQAAYFLHLAGEAPLASTFFRQAAAGRPAGIRAALAQMAIDLGRPQIGLRIAKDAAADGLVLPAQYYPLHAIAATRWQVPTEYALAIARQESEFDAGAASDAGARGLMQLMPATARHMADAAGQPYDPARLTADPLYNARLGTEYLAHMLERYDGAFVLATAAYNAGPGRVDQWLAENGDPRDPAVNPVDWIERIPFTETRNYVMRVLEGLHVYRARLEGVPVPVRLAADIAAGTPVQVSTRDFPAAAAAAAEAEPAAEPSPETAALPRAD